MDMNYLVCVEDILYEPCNEEYEHMYMETETEKQRNYLINRLVNAGHEQMHQLERHFGIADDEAPKTWKDLTDRIAKGRYVLPKNDQEGFGSRSLYDLDYTLRWRDPATVEDHEGFKVANEKRLAAQTAAKDQIMVSNPKEGLEALNTFTKTTFH